MTLNMGQGGAIPEFDDGGAAPPPDPQTPDMGGGGFGGGDTTPQPPAPNAQPPWGQSLGQDASHVGAIASTIPGQIAQNVSQGPAAQAGDAMSQKVQGLKDYISGKGAMPKDQFEQMNKAVDPNGSMDQNERSMKMLDATANDPTQAASVVQALRQHWDVQRGNAAKLLTEGNPTMAASEMSKGFQYVPDGTKTMVTPNKDGFTFTTHTMDGQDTTNYMDAAQTKQFLTGSHGLFDHVVGQGTGTVLSSISPPAPSGGASPEAGGPPPDSFAKTQVGDVAPTAKKGYPPENPATRDTSQAAYDPRADDPNADFGQGKNMVARNADEGRPVVPGKPGSPARTATPAEDKAYPAWHKAQAGRTAAKSSGGDTAPWTRKPTYTNPDDKTDDEINSPVAVVKAGHTTLQGNATAPSSASGDLKTMARQMAPNDPQGQSKIYEQQGSIAQEQASKLDVAKNTRVMGSQATAAGRNVDSANRAGATVQSALIKAQSVTDGTDKRFEGEQGRDAANILKQMMHDSPGAPIGDQIKALRNGNISDKLINHLVNPQATAPAAQPRQQRQLGGASAAQAPAASAAPKMAPPPEAIQMLKDHPETADHFDAVFGAGSSKQYSGQ